MTSLRRSIIILSLLVIIFQTGSAIAAERPRLYDAERIYPSGTLPFTAEFQDMAEGKNYPSHGNELAVYRVKETNVYFLCQYASKEPQSKVLLYTGKQEKWYLLSENEQSIVTCCGYYNTINDEFCPDDRFAEGVNDSPEILMRSPAYIGLPVETIGPFDIKPAFYRRGPEGKMMVIPNRLLLTTERPPAEASFATPETHYLAIVECQDVEYQSGTNRINWARVTGVTPESKEATVTFADDKNRIIDEDTCDVYAALQPLQRPSQQLPENYF